MKLIVRCKMDKTQYTKKSTKVLVSPEIRQGIKDEINRLISSRKEEFDVLKAVFKPNEFKAEIRKAVDFQIKTLFQNHFDNQQKDYLINLIKKYFSEYLFAKDIVKQVRSGVVEEIRTIVNDGTIHEYTNNLVKMYIKNNAEPITKSIIQSYISKVSFKLRKEEQIIKELCYSIDSEIKHTLMKAPISINTEEIIKNKLLRVLQIKTMAGGNTLLTQPSTEGNLITNSQKTSAKVSSNPKNT